MNISKPWTLPLGLLLLSLSVVAPTASAMDVNALLDKVAAAYGESALAGGVKAIRQTGRTYSSMRQAEGPLVRAYQYPDRFRVEIKYPGTEELRILRGKQVWKASQPMAGPFYGATLLQAARISLPWNLLKNRADVKDLGPVKTDDGRSLQALELALGEGLSVRVGIDTESGRILQSSGRMSGTMGIMEFGTSYEDFRQQNGILYAAMEKHSAMGNPTGYTHIDKIEFVDSLPDELFLPVDDTNRI